jgi:23S rRNA pseudouridine2605 synthase
MTIERLQKVLAQAGVASRRAAERLITEGRVRVNGRIVRELGSKANPARDRVEVDGRRLVSERPVYFLLHKPRGVVTTLDDPEGRKSVKDLLQGVPQRVFPVGRLDFQTSGALLLTNDGALAQALLHPTRAVPKTYNAKLEGQLDKPRLEALREGVLLDDGHKTGPADVKVLRSEGKFTSVEITIAEGKNRQIHRMGEAIARPVLRLTRISFAGLTLEGLRAGQMRPVTALELANLKQTYLQTGKRTRRPAYDNDEFDEASPFATASDVESAPQPAPRERSPRRGPDTRTVQRKGPAVRVDGQRPQPTRGVRTVQRKGPAVRVDGQRPQPTRGARTVQRKGPAVRVDGQRPQPTRGTRTVQRKGPPTRTSSAVRSQRRKP